VQVEIDTGPLDVLAEKTGVVGLLERRLEARMGSAMNSPRM